MSDAALVLGDRVDLLDHDLFQDHEPWEVFECLQREAPVYFHPEPGGRGFGAVTKYDDVLTVLKDPETATHQGRHRPPSLPSHPPRFEARR